jgi:aspartokinase/homoserine dehydrogenase 1
VTMISQSSSESSVCLAIPEEFANIAEMSLKRAFQNEMTRGDVEEIRVRTDVCLVAAVGLGMAHHPGVAARVFRAISAQGVNVLAIAQGSSELNISLAVDSQDVGAALRSVHREFGLHRQDTGDDAADRMDIILLGCGRVGRAFIAQLRARQEHIVERFGVMPRVVGLADRSGFVLNAKGLSADAIDAALDHKSTGGALADLDDGVAADSAVDLIDAAADWRMVRPVLVDVSDADSHDVFAAALTAGFDVVTANKIPVADTLARWTSLTTLAENTGRILKAEATVGAGLPVVDTLETLIATGDRVTRAQGCFSGTLGFLMTAVEDGVPLSEAVVQAISAGFTEPDPVVDLSGVDVARKALILARYANMVSGDVEVQLTGLVPADWAGLPLSELIERIKGMDTDMAAQTASAKARGEVLRFVAKVERDNIVVGLQSVPADSPVGRLRGSDNLVVFESDRYADRPLVVSGPGAGVEVTAMGVLGDLLRIVGERR